MTVGYGLDIRPRRPLSIRRHQTKEWGWRWDCRRCMQSSTRIPTWDRAVERALNHDCEQHRTNHNIGIGIGAPVYRARYRTGKGYLAAQHHTYT